MFRHNLLLIFRNFKKSKASFFINLIGLSTGLACTLLIYLWVVDELDFDKFHEKDAQLYQVMEKSNNDDEVRTNEFTTGLLAENMAKEFPEVQYAASVRKPDKYALTVGEKNINAIGIYGSKDFFTVFSYGLFQGDKSQVLADKSSIVISEKLARNLFNTSENVIGKTILFEHDKQFQVSGVFKGTPSNSSIQFDFVLSYDYYKTVNPRTLDWKYNTTFAYLVLKPGTNTDRFNNKIANFLKGRSGDSFRTLFIRSYSGAYLYGKYENGVQTGGRIEYVHIFSIIAAFILIIACINFTNLSTAMASKRLKEVGVKKVVGARRGTLILQYMGESMIMTFLSLLLAVILILLLLPQFNGVTGKQLSFHFSLQFSLALLGILLLTGLLAGSYPALYLSGFNPIKVLKGKLNTSFGEVWIRKGLVIFQFALSIIFIVSVLVIHKQVEYIQTKNLGYNKNNVLYFDMEGKVKANLETFLAEINAVPGVSGASSIGQNIIGGSNTNTGLSWPGKKPDEKIPFEIRAVNYGMIELLDIQMAAGRSFSRSFGAENTRIIFNEAAIKTMGLSDPVGKVVKIEQASFEIIGVTRDFHFASLHETVNPLLFVLYPNWTHKVMVRIEKGKEAAAIDKIQQLYQQYNPGFSLDFKFLDQDYQTQYEGEKRVASLSRYFAGLAILISSLGLFGLAAFTAERRLKEIAMRKILGATETRIVYLLSIDFTKIIIVSIIIALPVSFWVASSWLNDFVYRINLQWWFFAIAGLLALMIAWLTVGVHAVRAARISPVKNLRTD